MTRAGPLEKMPGGVLLSRGRLPQYPRRWGSSLPCSGWERVLHPRYGRQAKSLTQEPTEENVFDVEPRECFRTEEKTRSSRTAD